MFGWRKRKDGFEWHQYVRTTIKLRREARREKVEQLKQSAVDGVKVAGSAAGDAARVGARKLGAGSRMAAAIAGSALGRLVRASTSALAHFARHAGLWIGAAVKSRLGIPQVLAKLTPRGRVVAVGGAGIVAIALVSAISGLAGFSLHRFADVTTGSISPSRVLEGRASVVAGDTLRIGTDLVKLADIEAPERDQRCTRSGNRRWRCGEAAAAALGRLVGNRSISCEIRGSADGVALGLCRDGATDINAQLVRGGHVFAKEGLMSRYGSVENEAKAAKAGVWAGEAERPSAYRARFWEEAKRRAPEGCPIKATARGQARNYVLPWASDYDRVRVNTARGGRWFCSEQEAIAAGWTMARGG